MDLIQILLIVAVLAVVAGAAWFMSRRSQPTLEESRPGSAPTAPPQEKAGLAGRLTKTSSALGGALRGVFTRPATDQEFWESMEDALISADVGVEASTDIVSRVRAAKPEEPAEARAALRQALAAELRGRRRTLDLGDSKPAVVIVVGVNGSGKTTSIAKLGNLFHSLGRTSLLGAADTFRAAADTQLRAWGDRLGVDVVGGQEGADPAAVAYDAYQAARARGRDVVMIDTAGRLQSKHNLMAELTKIRRVLEREAERIDEVLLVLDATAGQNGISQVKEFSQAVGVTGIVLTKLDGTARGGIVVAVERQLDVPVKYVGVGEGLDDLLAFDPDEFVDALLADA